MDQLILNLPSEMITDLRAHCAKETINPNDYIKNLIEKSLPKQKESKKD